jgi:Arc/MetJ-type ribon-helix-helix transcriptional regulator
MWVDKEEGDEKETESKKDDKVVMMACCPEGGEAEKIKERVLLEIGEKLEDRCNVVETRLSDEDLTQIDARVEVEAFKSRSEAAAFSIREGILARKDLFEKVMPTVDKIRELKKQAKRSLVKG